MTSAEAEMAAFGLAFLVQGAGIVWWASAVNTRVKTAEKAFSELKSAFQAHDAADNERFEAAAVLAARLDERSTTLVTTLARVAAKLGV